MSVTVKKIAYGGWKNCCRIANGRVELIVTLDVGPRVIRFGFVGGPNEFKEYERQLGKRGGRRWRIYGGHRLWHAPETESRTYFPDNGPVAMEQRGAVMRFIQSVETTTGIQKEIDVRLAPRRARVELLHRLRNVGPWTVELAPWALSVMAPGGTAIVPLPPRGSHPEDLPPGNLLTLWLYTDMSDPRWTWGRKYIFLRQDGSPQATPQKLGALVPDGWAAYARNGHLFVKQFACARDATYADFGCNFETFTNHEMLELESLGPYVPVAPGQAVEHRETWTLFPDVPAPKTEREVDRHVLPLVRTLR
jgi:hypothetical protein